MSTEWDADIAAMALSDVEKNGMQFYKNFRTAIDKRRRSDMVEELDETSPNTAELGKLLGLIVSSEPLALTVIVCAYTDDLLKQMFKREIPSSVPGGRNELLNGFGPLSRLSQRIQIAFAFGWLSRDLLSELDLLRKIRNDISHKWDVSELHIKLEALINERQHPVEEQLADGITLPEGFYVNLMPIAKFRVRALWLVARLFYECQVFVPVLKMRLAPLEVLYSKEPPKLLGVIAAAALEKTQEVVAMNAREQAS